MHGLCSGKSTVARLLTAKLPGCLGAIHVPSDATRKHLYAVQLTDRLPPEAYTQESSEQTYAEVLNRCAIALQAGCENDLVPLFSSFGDGIHLRIYTHTLTQTYTDLTHTHVHTHTRLC